MSLFLQRNKYPVFLILIFLLAELIVNPIGEFPLNDDWSYSKTVLIMHQEGDLFIGNWCAMTLASHAVWGFLFTKSFGFSFFALRLSTFVSSTIGIVVLYRLLHLISKNPHMAFVGALTMLFNPIYFNLSNTFMTDVNFNTWLLLVFYFAFLFFESKSPIYFIMVFFMSAVLVLNRQFGIVLPFCFALSTLFLQEKKWKYFALSLLGSLAVLLIFKWYEHFLYHKLPEFSSYVISNRVSISDNDFFTRLKYNFGLRYKGVIIQVLFFAAPLAASVLYSIHKKLSLKTFAVLLGFTAVVIISMFDTTYFFIGNVFTNMSLGPETFYDSRMDFTRPEDSHTWSEVFKSIMDFFRLFFMTISASVIVYYLYEWFKKKSFYKTFSDGPLLVMLLAFFFTYIGLLCTSSSFFDRYLIPLITILLILFAFAAQTIKKGALLSLPFLLVMMYVSVAGTKDYFTLNRLRWEAVNWTKKESGLPVESINGGFEVNCWNDGQYNWWSDYINLENYNFLIQYKAEPGFRVIKEYDFQRYFPYKRDRIKVMVKNATP